MAARKREGDGATPLGRYAVRQVLYRPDRRMRPVTPLPVRAIGVDDGWSDDPKAPNYNRLVRLPSKTRAERLKRTDRLYDLVLVLGYNDRPRSKGKGSAIFIHAARPGYQPTEGCVALTPGDLAALLREVGPGTPIVIGD